MLSIRPPTNSAKSLHARIPLPCSLFLFHPLLFSFVRLRLTWDPAARERGSRAGIDSARVCMLLQRDRPVE